MQGRDLTPLIRGKEKKSRPAYMEFNIYWTPRSALVVDGRYKIIHDVDGDTGWYYDLSADPGETVRHSGTEKYHSLEKELLAVRERNQRLAEKLQDGRAVQAVKIPEDMAKSLKALGYIEN